MHQKRLIKSLSNLLMLQAKKSWCVNAPNLNADVGYNPPYSCYFIAPKWPSFLQSTLKTRSCA